jgi:nitrate/nitrite-specific signal transduction histidine kinase
LRIMQYRADHIGARFDIHTAKGQGTTVYVSMQLAGQNQ